MTSPLIIYNFFRDNGTPDGSRTRTLIQRGILSPLCLPIPPQEHIFSFFSFPYLVYILYIKNKELSIKKLVSVMGFEPMVSCLKGRCINRLCYTLIFLENFFKIFFQKSFKNSFKFFFFFSQPYNILYHKI